MDLQYKAKYLKYKEKYLKLKKLNAGGNPNDKTTLEPSQPKRLTGEELRLQEERLLEKERELSRLELKKENEQRVAEQRRKMEDDARIERERQNQLKNEMKVKLEKYKLEDKDCTAIFMKGNCKKAIVEFNNYLNEEINYVDNYPEHSISKQLLVIGNLNKLADSVSNEETKKLITQYSDMRSRIKFYLNPNGFYDKLNVLKEHIVKL